MSYRQRDRQQELHRAGSGAGRLCASGCYTSAPIPMPLFDALQIESGTRHSPEDTRRWRPRPASWWTATGRQVEQLWQSGAPVCRRKARPTERAARYGAGSLTACNLTANTPALQLRIYLAPSRKVTLLLCWGQRAGGGRHPTRAGGSSTRLHLMPYTAARRPGFPALDGRGDLAGQPDEPLGRRSAARRSSPRCCDWRAPDDCGPEGLSFAAARGTFGETSPRWVAYADLALLRAEAAPGAALSLRYGRPRHRSPPGAGAALRSAAQVCIVAGRRTQVLLCDPYAAAEDFDCESRCAGRLYGRVGQCGPADAPAQVQHAAAGRTRCSAWIRPVGTDAPASAASI